MTRPKHHAGNLEKGAIYECRHARKGEFECKILGVQGEWVDVQITKGQARMVSRGTPNAAVGDVLRVRDSFCYWSKRS